MTEETENECLKFKKFLASNGEVYFTNEYVEWLENVVGDVKIDAKWVRND